VTRQTAIRLSISLSVLAYFLLQALVWVFSIGIASALTTPYSWFFPVSGLVHLCMAAFLIWREDDFRHTGAGELLRRVNAACHLTLFRLSCAPTILFLAIGVDHGDTSGVILIGLAAIAFISDFFDGQVARRFNQTTEIGAYLDSSTDYAVLLVLSIAFVLISIMPVWYFVLLVVRFVGFAVAMAVLARVRGKVVAETTFLGKAAVFGAMIALAFELAGYAGVRGVGEPPVILAIEIASAVILAVSFVDKVIFLVKKFSRNPIDDV